MTENAVPNVIEQMAADTARALRERQATGLYDRAKERRDRKAALLERARAAGLNRRDARRLVQRSL